MAFSALERRWPSALRLFFWASTVTLAWLATHASFMALLNYAYELDGVRRPVARRFPRDVAARRPRHRRRGILLHQFGALYLLWPLGLVRGSRGTPSPCPRGRARRGGVRLRRAARARPLEFPLHRPSSCRGDPAEPPGLADGGVRCVRSGSPTCVGSATAGSRRGARRAAGVAGDCRGPRRSERSDNRLATRRSSAPPT